MNYPFNDAGRWAAGRDAIVKAFCACPEGHTVTFDTMAELTGHAVGATLYSMIQSAIRVSEKKHRVVMKSVPGTGYERARNDGRARKATSFGRSAFRKLDRTREIGETVDVNTLPPEKRASFAARMAALGAAAMFLRPQKVGSVTKKINNGRLEAGAVATMFSRRGAR